MKLLFLIRQLNDGGAQRQLLELASRLQSRGEQVSILTFYEGGTFWDQALERGLVVRSLGKGGRWALMGFYINLVRQLRAESPDAVLAYLGAANIFATLAKPFIGSTRVIWGVRAAAKDLVHGKWISEVIYRAESLLSRFADRIVVNSEAGRKFVLELGFAPDRVEVIFNGIDTDRFSHDAEQRRVFRTQWHLPESIPVLGMVGRLDPVKGHRKLLIVAKTLRKRGRKFRILIIGDGPDGFRKELQREVSEAGLQDWTVMLPSQRDLVPLYSGIDVLLSASDSEGFSNVIAEAMACGVPCVATNVGESANIVGDTGRIVGVEDIQAMTEACDALLFSKGGEAPRDRVLACFSMDALVSKTLSAVKKASS